MGVGADLIKGPVGQVIGLVVWLLVFPLILGAVNGWYLQSVSAGTVSGERFDRIVVKGTNDVEDAWKAATAVADSFTASAADSALDANTVYRVSNDGGDCTIGATDATAANNFIAATAYTPLGSVVKVPAVAGATTVDQIKITGCKWSEAGSVFGAGGLSGLIEIILQAAGLAAPIALLFALGTFGTSFLKNMGTHPILAAVMTVIAFLLVATLLNTFIPFLTTAFDAIDPNRFVMYSEGLGNVATVIGNFFGVVVVSSIMMVAWQLLQTLRTRNTISSGQQM